MRAAQLFYTHVDTMPAERCFHFQLHSNTDNIVDIVVKVPGTAEEFSEATALAAAQAKLLTTIEEVAIRQQAGTELWRISTCLSSLYN